MTAGTKQWLIARATALGFDAIRVTRPDAIGQAGERLDAFLARGRQGDMDWMATHADRRRDPRTLWPGVRSVVSVGMSYAPPSNPLDALDDKQRGIVSAYAKGKDYHDVVKGKLKHLAGNLPARSGADVKVFVDTAPVMEKPLAAAAGIGWQGKHTNLVSRATIGSWLFLGAILTTAELPPDAPEEDHCGSCRALPRHLPDRAPSPRPTGSMRGAASPTSRSSTRARSRASSGAPIGNRVYGCDDCLAVCPWNKFARRRHARSGWRPARGSRPRRRSPNCWPSTTPASAQLFAGSPVKRTGRDRFVRNVLIAAGNSGDASLVAPALGACSTTRSPLVRGAAVWALSRLMPAGRFAALAADRLRTETEAEVARTCDRERVPPQGAAA